MDLPTNISFDLMKYYYCKIMDCNYFLKKFDNTTMMPKGLKYKMFTKEEFENSEEKWILLNHNTDITYENFIE